ncbi:hypothetical protein FGO68_gene12932 [Halteria grandinella]|uniref:Uncharacterized protein n=1 Tax=Halteria grandinella TaxID=5974 RepID=A0A8J8NDF3_HALGN|nr:hypothetical protein FGO68_gene12932 [Halteria grandinella]
MVRLRFHWDTNSSSYSTFLNFSRYEQPVMQVMLSADPEPQHKQLVQELPECKVGIALLGHFHKPLEPSFHHEDSKHHFRLH